MQFCRIFKILQTMEKSQYENLKNLRQKTKNGTANFKERNVLKIIEKRKKQGKKVHA